MKNLIVAGCALMIGLGLGYLAKVSTQDSQMTGDGSGRAEPLYWVAPMDPNFRRDGPGKSPMGMDLVPVYADDGASAGEVRISPAVEHNIGVRTGMVRRGKLRDEITTVGHVDYDETRVHGVHPRVEGWLTRLYVKSTGEPVDKGAALYDLYSPALVNAQEEFLTAVLSGDAKLIESARMRLAAYNVPASIIERVEKERRVLQSVTFFSPNAGIVRSIDVAEGAFVNPGARLMTLADLSHVWLTAEIFETDVARIEPGEEMRFRTAFDPGQIRVASVDFVYPVLEAVTRTLQVRATVDNSDGRLRPNMFADLSIPLSSEAETLLVPKSAVIRTEDQDRVVMLAASGGYKSVAVTVGRSGKSDVEILEGLKAGDRVVTSAQFLIDSESSKSSDFERMSLAAADSAGMSHSDMNHAGMDHSRMNHEEMDHSKMDHGEMDHGEMDHGEMDHGEMDHGEMDHGEMDHGEMDHGEMDHGEMDHGEMDHSTMDHGEAGHTQMEQGRDVWTRATIRAVNADAGTISLTHEPIPAWSWPTMTMTMDAGSGVDLGQIRPGETYRIHIVEAPDRSTGYVVMHVEKADEDAREQ